MSEFKIGEKVSVEPDFSNDDFEPFVGTIVAIIAAGIQYEIADEDGDVQPWMWGNINKIN